MNTARLAIVAALATLGLIAVGTAATGGDPATTAPPITTTLAPVSDPGTADPAPPPGGAGPAPAGGIGFDEAVRIALERTGGGTVTDAEWDYERGRDVWEIDIRKTGTEHEILLDAGSGDVLRHERDWPDHDDDCG